MPCYLLTAVGAVFLVLFIREKIKAYSLKAVFIKSVVSALFLAVGACGWFLSSRAGGLSLTGVFVLLGLLCGLLGDLWLDLKFVYPAEDEPYTYVGMGAFGVGHILYFTGLMLEYYPKGKPRYAVLPVAAAIVMSAVNLLLEKPMRLRYGKMKPVVFTYGVLIFSTLALSFSLALSRAWHEPALNLFFAGMVLFAVSDVILSGTYWGEGKQRPIDLALNYLTYYPGQYLIALSLLFIAAA